MSPSDRFNCNTISKHMSLQWRYHRTADTLLTFMVDMTITAEPMRNEGIASRSRRTPESTMLTIKCVLDLVSDINLVIRLQTMGSLRKALICQCGKKMTVFETQRTRDGYCFRCTEC
ncbi:hypothetical protein EWB00_009066 [Schistosoma japonicum]|uniref:Uncharacterized protein n=1 Tax=Schistosoma japonicum TaxID=6182 RepID=A0A4Z2DRZ1_SCHJA|nr:hypothetical protein EWB00_009066 [Schistosoma japonicum]TNN19335.1 hypothetical protein EWB00_009066 [Schistosoma japonicum]